MEVFAGIGIDFKIVKTVQFTLIKRLTAFKRSGSHQSYVPSIDDTVPGEEPRGTCDCSLIQPTDATTSILGLARVPVDCAIVECLATSEFCVPDESHRIRVITTGIIALLTNDGALIFRRRACTGVCRLTRESIESTVVNQFTSLECRCSDEFDAGTVGRTSTNWGVARLTSDRSLVCTSQTTGSTLRMFAESIDSTQVGLNTTAKRGLPNKSNGVTRIGSTNGEVTIVTSNRS